MQDDDRGQVSVPGDVVEADASGARLHEAMDDAGQEIMGLRMGDKKPVNAPTTVVADDPADRKGRLVFITRGIVEREVRALFDAVGGLVAARPREGGDLEKTGFPLSRE